MLSTARSGGDVKASRYGVWWIALAICIVVSLVVVAAGCGGAATASTTTGGGTATTAAGTATTAAAPGTTAASTATTAAPTETTAAGTATTAAAAPTGDPVVIGFAAGLTGDASAGDVPLLQGLEYTVDQLNKAGGIAGHPVKLITKDTKSDVALGATVANQLIDEGAQIMVGPCFPGFAAGVIQASAARGVTTLGGDSTQPEYTKVGGAQAYLAAFGDNVQAAAIAEYALEKGYKTAYTLVSPDLSYTAMLPVFFKDVFEKGGGTVVGTDNFTIGQPDFSSQVTKIAGLNPQPDVLYFPMFPPDIGTMLTQLRAAGVKTPVMGADGFDMQALIDLAGPSAEGVVFSTHGFPNPGSPVESWVKGYTAWKGKAPESSALGGVGCDVVYIVKAAVEAAGSLDPKAIGAALANLENVKVVTGTVTYKGTTGVPLKTVSIVTVKDGKFAFVEERIPKFVPSE
jgi:branched-chain amino acid transport system substrate-binding protein